MKNLFENTYQKIVWVIYVFVTVIILWAVDKSNNESLYCLYKNRCYSSLRVLIITTTIFIVITAILQTKKNNDTKKS